MTSMIGGKRRTEVLIAVEAEDRRVQIVPDKCFRILGVGDFAPLIFVVTIEIEVDRNRSAGEAGVAGDGGHHFAAFEGFNATESAAL